MPKGVNGWAVFSYDEAMQLMCGAQHIWFIYEEGMPCMCGQRVRAEKAFVGFLPAEYAGLERPNAAHRFGYMSHHIEGECGCHPPDKGTAITLLRAPNGGGE